jgi:hypothetical protein
MALYVSVCLLAALTAVADSTTEGHASVFKIIWGTTLGLALAHWFAFRLSARLTAFGTMRSHDAAIAAAQLAGAAAVAVLATVPLLVVPDEAELDIVRLLLAGFIALVGFVVARSSGASTARAVLYGAGVIVVGLIVAVMKNVLGGH